MFTQLLVPLDGSPASELALRYAFRLSSRLHLVHVALSRPTESQHYRMVPAEIRQQKEQYLKELVARLSRPGRKLTWSVEEADAAADGIVACARRVRASAIVMTTQGRTGLSRILLGSVTEKVTRHAPCPVLSARLEVAERKLEAATASAAS